MEGGSEKRRKRANLGCCQWRESGLGHEKRKHLRWILKKKRQRSQKHMLFSSPRSPLSSLASSIPQIGDLSEELQARRLTLSHERPAPMVRLQLRRTNAAKTVVFFLIPRCSSAAYRRDRQMAKHSRRHTHTPHCLASSRSGYRGDFQGPTTRVWAEERMN